MQLGILMAGRFMEELAQDHGQTDVQIASYLEQAGTGFSFKSYATCDGELPQSLDECDGYIISGSAHGAYDDLDWFPSLFSFIRQAAKRGPKLFGICFGHQAIAMALGGRVEKAAVGWGMGVHTYEILQPAPWMTPATSGLSLLVSHQDQVLEAPPGAVIHASSAFCPIASLSLGSNIFTLQPHPEHRPELTRALATRRRERLGEARADKAIASLGQPTDEQAVAGWIKNFFEECR
ncbi:MAG: hypothetical protein AAF530_25345 [Pseudomonadota bacterium]